MVFGIQRTAVRIQKSPIQCVDPVGDVVLADQVWLS